MSTGRIKTWFRQLMCNHLWVSSGDMCQFTVREDGATVEYLSDNMTCSRCGKHKTECVKIPSHFI